VEAATILEDNARSSSLPEMEAAAGECRAAAGAIVESDLIGICRQIATKLARQASTLASEVQQQSRRRVQTNIDPHSPKPMSSPGAVGPAAISPSPRQHQASERAEDRKPVPSQPSRQAALARVRVARSEFERELVAAALERGDRFVRIGAEAIIDVKQDRMWLGQMVPPGKYRSALAFVASLRGDKYSDWRLPRPDEVQQLLADGGRTWVVDNGLVPRPSTSASSVRVWTRDERWVWLRLRKEITVVDLSTSAISWVAASRRLLPALVVR
jgi:hypothetical protein